MSYSSYSFTDSCPSEAGSTVQRCLQRPLLMGTLRVGFHLDLTIQWVRSL